MDDMKIDGTRTDGLIIDGRQNGQNAKSRGSVQSKIMPLLLRN